MTDVMEAADGELEEAEGVVEEPPRSRRRLYLVIAAAVLVLLLGIGAALYFLVFSGDNDDEALAAVEKTYFYDMPTMTVNLSAEDGEDAQFLKLSISLELASADMLAVAEPRMARVRDAFQVYLRELRRSDLEGSAGIFRLKEELRRRVNLAIYPAQVDNILFKEILVQ